MRKGMKCTSRCVMVRMQDASGDLVMVIKEEKDRDRGRQQDVEIFAWSWLDGAG